MQNSKSKDTNQGKTGDKRNSGRTRHRHEQEHEHEHEHEHEQKHEADRIQ